jgi:hypothetical protein
MNPEVKQQLYGGEISDYYPDNKKQTSPETDNKNIGDIYQQIINNKLKNLTKK